MVEKYPIYGNGYPIIQKFGKEFVQIYLHDSSHRDFFKDKSEVLFLQTKYKQSVIGFINDKFRVEDNLFEFYLYYPTLDVHIHWTQNTPITENTTNTQYKIFKEDTSNISVFGGLALTYDYNMTYIDGATGTASPHWWYSIGSYSHYREIDKYPGPNKDGSYLTVPLSKLYIRLSNIMLIEEFPPWRTICSIIYLKKKLIIENPIFTIIFLPIS